MFHFRSLWRLVLLWTSLCLFRTSHALKLFESNSLNSCMKDSSFAASLFHVTFTPVNNTVTFDINGFSEETANVVLDVEVLGYGHSIAHPIIDPCKQKELAGMCPMNAAPIQMKGNIPVAADTVKKIPGIVYTIPDLDLKVRVWINSTDTGKPLACVEANLGTGKTVHHRSVALSIALIVLLALVVSAVISGLGHSNTSAHLASNALALFSYFQAQALIGMTAVATPPIVRAWTQNFQWTMGIIYVSFLQTLATWYQRATGGKPSTYLTDVVTTSVQVQKRSLSERSNNAAHYAKDMKFLAVKGIERVGFVENIEVTNIFFTSYMFFFIFVLFTIIGVLFFKHLFELLVRMRKMHPEKFYEFRTGWTNILKGILFRVVLITFPQMVVLCFWEITKRDSNALLLIAITSVLAIIVSLGIASMKVWKYGRRSIQLHQNPAYILYSDIKCLNKWGFLYVQYEATKYFFVIPVLLYLLVKGLFIALGQNSGLLQAIALLVLELAMLLATSIMRPYMNKKTNALHISITAVNFVNAFLLLFFTEKLGVPALAIGIMGVLFFLINVIFAFIAVILVLWTSISAVTSKDPETRYQPMRDGKASDIKSRSNLNIELDPIGNASRGTKPRRMSIDEEGEEPMRMRTRQEFDRSGRHFGTRSPDELGGGVHDGRYSSLTGTGSVRDSQSRLLPVHSASPLPGSGFATPVRTESPMPRTHSPANWKRGLGY